MSTQSGVNRRTFLKSAGLTALAGVTTGGASGPALASRVDRAPATYDFDDVYDRVGTDCYKWDKQLEAFSPHDIVVPMGIADMDFRTAPAITAALVDRIQHENWGYMHVPPSFRQSMIDWNRRRYGVEIEEHQLLTATGVNPAILSGLRAFSPPGCG